MKVRCTKDFEKDDIIYKKGKVFDVDDNGITNIVVDTTNRCIITFDDERFFKYFEFVEFVEGLDNNYNYSFIKEMLINVADLIDKKNKDYGNSYHTTREKYGHTAFLIRLSDKISRYEQLMEGNRLGLVEDESLIDTLEDIIGYTALEIQYLSGKNE